MTVVTATTVTAPATTVTARNYGRRVRSIPFEPRLPHSPFFSVPPPCPGSADRARGAKERGGNFDLFAGACVCSAACDSLDAPGHRRSVNLWTPAGLEGGLEEDKEGKLQCFAWMIVLDATGDKVGSARTSTFELPEKVIGHETIQASRACPLPLAGN